MNSNKKEKTILLKKTGFMTMLLIVFSLSLHYGQEGLKWPNTPASEVFQDFIKAYNSGKEKKVENFVKKHYQKTDTEYVYNKVDTWMDYFYRFGEVAPHSISINQPNDLEVWLQGKTSEAWFAVEFVLDKERHKIKGTAVLQGALPDGLNLGSTDDDALLKKFKTYLKANEEKNLFQGTVLLQKGNEVLIDEGYGYKNIDQKIKNTKNTRIDFMSITKMFTAVACLQLVQQGVLDLNATIDKYLPELPEHIASQITIETLLNHTSGYELDGIEGFREAQDKATSIQEMYALQLKYLPKWEHYQSFTPTGKYDYTNDSFDLAAVIIEKVTNMRFEDYLKKYIFDIAKMTYTSFERGGVAKSYRYYLSDKGLKEVSQFYPSGWISAAGGLVGTTEDLRLFFNTLIKTNKLLDYTHRNILFTPTVYESTASNVFMNNDFISIDSSELKAKNSYGLGTIISYDAQLNIGHAGVRNGSCSELRYFPESDYLLIVLANNRNGAKNAYNFFKNSLPRE
ncbi:MULTISPECIES: serine hydrolase domain-containing protein [Flavobacteriaceae]|uniref:serine hydrolase domain-containing protein n=1 Tax=Flavobacteriaceae TaxID=49546 RepID=UPI00149125F4|nr:MULTISPECIES: serine hydrolase domain-containing protein [Allomuricauda]MDC6366975.1 serine hydrolase [Muricauda sp. AC10]